MTYSKKIVYAYDQFKLYRKELTKLVILAAITPIIIYFLLNTLQ